MKIELNPTTIEGRRVWEWWVKQGRRVLAGGMCATKADAAHDAGVWLSLHRQIPPDRRPPALVFAHAGFTPEAREPRCYTKPDPRGREHGCFQSLLLPRNRYHVRHSLRHYEMSFPCASDFLNWAADCT